MKANISSDVFYFSIFVNEVVPFDTSHWIRYPIGSSMTKKRDSLARECSSGW